MGRTLYLFDDSVARSWSPFSETRPVGELRFGSWTLRERALACTNTSGGDHLGCSELSGFAEPGSGSIAEFDAVDGSEHACIWLSRAAAAADQGDDRLAEVPASPVCYQINGTVVGVSLPPGTPAAQELLDLLGGTTVPSGISVVEVKGTVLSGPWSLVEKNAAELAADLRAAIPFTEVPLPEGSYLTGPPELSLGERVEIGPGVIFDTRSGPIRLDDGCVVEGPARIVGPVHLGPGCVVFGGHLSSLAAGPICKLRGEISETVICGFSNKAHDGYLGHALLGRWVNLGAGTTNSDLKNNYSEVRVTTGSGTHDTGLIKVGVFLGDHVKTGIGTMLNTGTAVGAGSNVFGGGVPPKWIPPFSWCWPKGIRAFRFDSFEEVAEIVMARRGQSLSQGLSDLFRRVHTATHSGSDSEA